MLKINKRTALFFGILAFSIGGLFIWQTKATKGITDDEEYNQQIRNALAEIKFPNENNPDEISSATENLADFIFYRSGVKLNSANKKLLKEIEQSSWQKSKKIDQKQLAQILTDIAAEKISAATDNDIVYAAKTLKGFDAPDLPLSFKKFVYVKLRANGEGSIKENEFIEQAKVFRNTVKNNKTARLFIFSAISREISDLTNLLAKASPADFKNPNTELTPLQALLVTYTIATDDYLTGNKVELEQNLEKMQKDISRLIKESYPSPKGHYAYGVNGYKFSTPTDLLLDDAAVLKILTLVRERNNF